MTYRYPFPRPALTVDVLLVRGTGEAREGLFVRRQHEPFAERWALPGGFVDEMEVIEEAARRELREETGVDFGGRLRQIGTYGEPGRDPRGWTVTVAFLGRWDERGEGADEPHAGSDAASVEWFRAADLPTLAFDHADIAADGFDLDEHVSRD